MYYPLEEILKFVIFVIGLWLFIKVCNAVSKKRNEIDIHIGSDSDPMNRVNYNRRANNGHRRGDRYDINNYPAYSD